MQIYRKHDSYASMSVEHVYAVIAMFFVLKARGSTEGQIVDTVNAVFVARRRLYDMSL